MRCDLQWQIGCRNMTCITSAVCACVKCMCMCVYEPAHARTRGRDKGAEDQRQTKYLLNDT